MTPGDAFQAPAPPVRRTRHERVLAYEMRKLDQADTPVIVATPQPTERAS